MPIALPSVLTQFRDRPVPAGEASEQWLTIAYGHDEAQAAMLLPESLREELYGDVLWFGPAADELNRFAYRMAEANPVGTTNNLIEDALWNVHHKLNAVGQSSTGGFIQMSIHSWSNHTGCEILKVQFMNLDEHSLHRAWQTNNAMSLMCWFITGQYLFSDELIRECEPYLADVEYVLDLLELPHLQGKWLGVEAE